MQTILITGGTGFIGSHCTVELIEKGYKIIIVDNLSNSSIDFLNRIKNITGIKPNFYQIDLKNKIDLKKVFIENKIDAVMHFAGAKAVGESISEPFFYYENNIMGSINLFELMNEFNVKNILFSSSATVYTPNKNPPFIENDSTGNTTNPYGTTKLIIENILRDLSICKGFRVINLRYFNPIGAHKSGLIGENPKGIPNNLLPYIMKVAIGEIKEVTIFGNDYDTIDGTGMRDYIHIIDLIDGHIKSLDFIKKNIDKNGFFEIFNLGTGKATSVLEMINFTSEVTGINIPYIITEKRFGDLAISYCNPKKANEILGWKNKYSVKEAIKDSFNFFSKV